jgi:uncharacterized protein YdeI (YjbR/CyaY-like superfamily)
MPRKPAQTARPSKLPSERVHPPDRAAWREWLSANHASSNGVWLVFDKKAHRKDRLAYADAVEEGLCFGWIDSVLRPVSDEHYMQLFTPRKPKSVWSKLNKDRVARLVEQKLMMPAGLAMVEIAQRSGTWTALDSVEADTVPPDLASALGAKPAAARNFAAFAPSARKAYLYWINAAKRPETRTARIREVVRLAAANKKTRQQV